MIGTVREKFIKISERYEPIKNYGDGVYISNSFDATSHFESETENVLNLYKQISGKDLDLTNLPEDVDEWLNIKTYIEPLFIQIFIKYSMLN